MEREYDNLEHDKEYYDRLIIKFRVDHEGNSKCQLGIILYTIDLNLELMQKQKTYENIIYRKLVDVQVAIVALRLNAASTLITSAT